MISLWLLKFAANWWLVVSLLAAIIVLLARSFGSPPNTCLLVATSPGFFLETIIGFEFVLFQPQLKAWLAGLIGALFIWVVIIPFNVIPFTIFVVQAVRRMQLGSKLVRDWNNSDDITMWVVVASHGLTQIWLRAEQ